MRNFDNVYDNVIVLKKGVETEHEGFGLRIQVVGTDVFDQVEIVIGRECNPPIFVDKHTAAYLAEFFATLQGHLSDEL